MNLRTQSKLWLVVGGATMVIFVSVFALSIGIFSSDPNLVHVFHMQKIITTVAINGDGRITAAGNTEGMVSIWEIQEDIRKRQDSVHQCSISAMAFSPDNQYLITGGTDGAVFVRDIATEKPPRSILDAQTDPCTAHGRDILSIAVHPEASTVAVSIRNAGVQLIDVNNGEMVHTFSKQADRRAIEHLAFSSDGKSLMMVYGDAIIQNAIIQIVNTSDNQIICEFEQVSDDVVSSTAFTPEDEVRIGTYLQVEEWSLSTCSHLRFRGIDPPSHTRIVTLSTDGSLVMLSGAQRADLLGGFPLIGQPDPRIFMINIEHPERHVQFQGHERYVIDATVSQNREFFVSGSADDTVRLWRVPGFEE